MIRVPGVTVALCNFGSSFRVTLRFCIVFKMCCFAFVCSIKSHGLVLGRYKLEIVTFAGATAIQYEGCSLISAIGFVTCKSALPPQSEHQNYKI